MSEAIRRVASCRLCESSDLAAVLDLGQFAYTGIFPKPGEEVPRGPLALVRCLRCGLLQLEHRYPPASLYGAHYGYRSGLNQTMVKHLRTTATGLAERVGLGADDLVLDIGASDGTLLASYPVGPTLVGFDPSAEKFRMFYRPDITLITDFFSANAFKAQFPSRAARLVTSIAMFYDLERPLDFAREVTDILSDDGLWHFEQSYLPSMLQQTAYDTICHEHTEYYAMRQIKWITDHAGLKIVDVRLNDVNGGSFAITACRTAAPWPEATREIALLLEREQALGLDGSAPYSEFVDRVRGHRLQLVDFLADARRRGRQIFGYGASTKGNVILQYCGVTPEMLPCIAEVNADKLGMVTPGTGIPIVAEEAARALRPECFLVFPWHFRENIVQREARYLAGGGRLAFPLPSLTIVSK